MKRLVHLIWAIKNATVDKPPNKDNNEGKPAPQPIKDTKGVRAALINCYQELYFAPLVQQQGKSVAAQTYIPKRTARCDDGARIEDMLNKLWEFYPTFKEISQRQRRGAAIVLGMLAAPRPSVVADHLDKLVAVGLGAMGKGDLMLARDSCIALSRLGESAKKAAPGEEEDTSRMGSASLLGPSSMSASQQQHKHRALLVGPFKLSQLIFLAGHVAVKHPVHLELIKHEFKRHKAANNQALRPVVLSSPQSSPIFAAKIKGCFVQSDIPIISLTFP
ncbi:hypothetical protein PTTG_09749 [Puccinia triticina 1-1 BBBD Race 1]|uniref:Uncharacterized protein n=1 Tax=Puccinia triticina (isolate 1-1 / race 1 (BBBD)) TaxID=630390 RepID=A0A0C4F981_PUCT1|nr:hypothetical protein PTTG_09749 [Puccinia triticina 1-1 BBBD Race 1]